MMNFKPNKHKLKKKHYFQNVNKKSEEEGVVGMVGRKREESVWVGPY